MKKIALVVGITAALGVNSAQADQVILDDLIVDGSICAGMDCVNGESFGFDTIRLKENNLRIRAVDTSSTSSFPSRDWQITFNDSSNGGLDKFSIDDIDSGRTPFTIEGNAPSHSLYVDDGGRIGVGTSTPTVQMHIKDGNTPTTRLEQDGSSGFTPQVWDVAGNEANFFVRDATNGSTLPFRIQAGAPNNSLTVMSDGKVGMGTWSPSWNLDLQASGTVVSQFESTDDGAVQIWLNSASTNRRLVGYDGGNIQSQMVLSDGEIQLAGQSNTSNLFAAFNATGTEINGNLIVSGTVTVGSTQVHPDYVFKSDYDLMSLEALKTFVDENKHLPEIPSAKEVAEKGLNMTEMQIKLLKKVEELTLYTINQQETINKLTGQIARLEDKAN